MEAEDRSILHRTMMDKDRKKHAEEETQGRSDRQLKERRESVFCLIVQGKQPVMVGKAEQWFRT